MSGKRNWGDNVTHRQDGKEPPAVVDAVKMPPSRYWRRKWKCKKNKGNHTFEIEMIHGGRNWRIGKDGRWENWNYGWSFMRLPYWVEWRCSACSKKETEWNAPEKKFDKDRERMFGPLTASL